MECESRLEVIKRLIEQNEIRNQVELQLLLRKAGHEVNQSTLSRDLSKINIVKERNSQGKLYYVLASPTIDSDKIMVSKSNLVITFSNHLAVLRTRPGYANGIAGDIDAHRLPEVIATIAGDDTILLIPRQGTTDKRLVEALRELLPDLEVND